MAIRIMPAKRVRKAKTKNGKEVLRRLEEYLKGGCNVPVEILCGFWKDQRDAITYQELRQAVQDGAISPETLRLWSQDYSVLVADKLSGLWTDGIQAGMRGQPILDGLVFSLQTPGIWKWISERGAEFVTASTQEQKNAIAALLAKKMRERHTVDELARLIRPCIGLTERDAKAAVRLYDSIVETLKKDHPRMKPESIRRKALDATQKYAERKHRQRALTIAQTESAFAYNRGADEGIRQAQAAGYLGAVRKRWCTSGDDAVCEICASLEGLEIDMEAEFGFRDRVLFPGHKLLPPAHPRCACAVEYIEVSPSTMPEFEVDIHVDNSLRTYTDTEIYDIAEQTEAIVKKHIDVPGRWSGSIVIDDSLGRCGKMWNCDILTTHEVSPHMIMHEQIHARSISIFEDAESLFVQFRNIEEATVQYMTQEISKLEKIEIIASDYDVMVDALRTMREKVLPFDDDYSFAKFLIEKPLTERLMWLESEMYGKMGENKELTVGDYQELSELLNLLY